jgi:hypothetical protein
MFENKLAFGNVYYSRIIASWINEGGKINHYGRRANQGVDDFEDWLRTLEWNNKTLSDEEIRDIRELATNGKMEFEYSARTFLKDKA